MRQHHEESTEHFFTSFTDLLVGVIFLFMLLLMVFALNLKNAEIDKPKIVSEEIRANLLREISRRMEGRGTPVTLDLANGVVRLPEAQLFESGQWKLSTEGEKMVASFAAVLGEVLPCAAQSTQPCQWTVQPLPLDSVLIEGHTDKRPFTSPQGYGNWELSAFRAITVYKAMAAAEPALEQSIFNTGNQPILGVSAYADRRPVDTATLDPNRRIDIRFNMHAVNFQSLVAPAAKP
jgi:flagellar motor protein MotB